ncbi:MAG TPA: NADPH:quinone oxidoreductase family protein [Candidatus Dormibacteraeota bacterium]|jgi:NADPH2:quinone reductase|nr:NADPH:quinone oxidoreductase family protein [Candidatus Dormibacteraeota bacterium]
MKAWVVRAWGDPDSMALEELDPGPTPAGLLRLKVEAAAVNFFDALMIAGTYQVKPEFPFTPGGEAAGTVLEAPEDSGLAPGDRVMAGMMAGAGQGGYASESFAFPRLTRRIPDGMTFEDAAALNVVYQTAYFGLHRRGQLQPGETLLVHGAAGGTGTAAIQVGKAAGATVIATAGSDEKVALCLELGADHAVNYKTQDFAEEVNRITERRGADVIFDPVGGDVFDRSTKCIAFEGRLVVVGFTSGRIPEARANHLLVKNYAVVGLHWGAYEMRRPEVVEETAQALFRLYEEGRIKPHISATFPLSRAPEALKAVASGRSTGKVLIVPDPPGSAPD